MYLAGDCSAISPAILIAPHRDGLPFFFSFPETRLYLTQAVIGPDGSISHLFGALATQVMGQSIRMERCDQPNLLDVGRAYSRALVAEGWKGPVNVQMKCTPTGDFVPFELNGRFTGGTAARTLLGFDEVAEAIARFLPVADFPSRPGAVAEIVQNYLASYGIYSAGVAGQPALDQPFGRWRLDDRLFTRPVGVFGPVRHDHPELRRDHIEPLGGVLADRMQR